MLLVVQRVEVVAVATGDGSEAEQGQHHHEGAGCYLGMCGEMLHGGVKERGNNEEASIMKS